MTYDSHLNALEKSVLESFGKAASGERCTTTHFFKGEDDFGYVHWLEALPIQGKGWFILHKQCDINDFQNINQNILHEEETLFNAMSIMSEFERGQTVDFGEPLSNTDDRNPLPQSVPHYTEMALKAGIVFNIDGRPHPLIAGQIVGDQNFSKEIYQSAEEAYQKSAYGMLERTRHIVASPFQSSQHYFDEIMVLETALERIELAERSCLYINIDDDDFSPPEYLNRYFDLDVNFSNELIKKSNKKYGRLRFNSNLVLYRNIAYTIMLDAGEQCEKSLSKSILGQSSQSLEKVSEAFRLLQLFTSLSLSVEAYKKFKDHKKWHQIYVDVKDRTEQLYMDFAGCSVQEAKEFVEKQIMLEVEKLQDRATINSIKNQTKQWLRAAIKELKHQTVGIENPNKTMPNLPRVNMA